MTLAQFFGQPLTCDVPSDQIQLWFAILAPLLPSLPDLDLSTEQLQTINGYLLPVGPELVQLVVRALSEQGALFPDIPTPPGELEQTQTRATSWRMLRDAALVVADRADRAYRLEQAQAVFKALQAVLQVRADQLRPFSGPAESARRSAMEPAERALAAYQDQLQGR